MTTADQSAVAARGRSLLGSFLGSLLGSRLPCDWTVRELEASLGVPPEHIRLHPPLGLATEQEVVDLEAHCDHLRRHARAAGLAPV